MAFADSFASGFNSGLGTGLEQYNIAQRRKLAEEQAAREAEAHALRMEEARRAAAQARRIEDARSALETASMQGMPTGAVPKLGEATTADTYFGRTGYGQGLPAVQAMAGDYQREMGRFGLPQQAAEYDTTGVGTRNATERDINRLTQQYALAANDINAYRGLRNEAADMDWKDAFAARLKAARNMSPDEFAARMKQISDDQTLPGTFEWEQGKGDKEGKYFFLTPDRAMRLPLSKSEVVQLIALEELAQEDPVRAEEQIANLTGKAREVAFKVAQLINQQVATNNQAVNMTQDNARGERQLDLQEQALGIQRARLALDRRGSSEGRPQWATYYDENTKQVVPVDLNRLPIKDGVAQLPPGLRALKSPQELSPNDRIARITSVYEQLAANPPTEVVNGKEVPVSQDRLWGLAAQQVDRMLGQGGSAEQGALTPELVQRMLDLQNARTQGRNQPAATPAAPTGQKVFGPLTPRAVVEAEARAGNPAAIRFLQQQQANQDELIRSRATGLPMVAP